MPQKRCRPEGIIAVARYDGGPSSARAGGCLSFTAIGIREASSCRGRKAYGA